MNIFVTGTGTDVGKTTLCTALVQGLSARGLMARYWKPVETGGRDLDASQVQAPFEPTFASFPLPASPDQAAAAANLPAPTVAQLAHALSHLASAQLRLVEGAGGLAVPLNDAAETWLDFLRTTRLPCVIAAASGLGTLNHTSLTLRALAAAGADVLGVVLCGPRHAANEASLARMHPGLAITSYDLDARADDAPAHLATWLLNTVDVHTSTTSPRAWLDLDTRHVWHPYTQHETAPPPLPVVAARGVHLTLADGRRLVDGASSWWVNTIGHGRPEIGAAIARQQARVDHVIFAGATHEPASRVAARLVHLAATPRLERVFFSDNGSTAVEIALKMVYQRWANAGEPARTTFVSFAGSYHGDTFGTMAVAASAGFHATFAPFLFAARHAPVVTRHVSSLCPRGEAALEERLATFAALLDELGPKAAGVIVEPLVQGAAGMLVQPPAFLQGVAALCRARSLPLIADEVFTGLGRVGATFAFQRAGIEPDVVCTAKALTGGNLPLAVTLARTELFDACLGADTSRALLHGHSYTANAIACAAALAALDVMEKDELPRRALALEHRFDTWLAREGFKLRVENGRTLGGILAFELPGSGSGNYFHARAAKVRETAAQHALFLRPLGNTLYFMPPLVIDDETLEAALFALASTVAAL